MDNSHKTAITRKKLSAPTKVLLDLDLIKGSVLDYGCGQGYDADHLCMDKYDPHFFPKLDKRKKYDTIICNYVLNVVSLEEEDAIINNILIKLKVNGVAYITVRRDNFKEGFNKRGTFQRMSRPNLRSVHLKKYGFEIYTMGKI